MEKLCTLTNLHLQTDTDYHRLISSINESVERGFRARHYQPRKLYTVTFKTVGFFMDYNLGLRHCLFFWSHCLIAGYTVDSTK
jgi:hypothetical protein